MSEQPDPQPTASSVERLRLPRRTTPTWEIELLISGALVFSLFSLRQPLEDYFAGSLPVATKVVEPLVVYSYVYSKLVLFVLLITFVLHLTARARWVALVGVHSIYPKGPNWDNLGGGPLSKRLTRRDTADIDEAIERADNLASLIFGYGMLAATMSLMIMMVSMIVFSVMAVMRWAGMPEQYETPLIVLMALVMILAVPLDKYVVPRLGIDHWFSRLTDRLLKLTYMVTLAKAQQPLNSLITTNFGGKRGPWVLIGLIYLIIGLSAADTWLRLAPGSLIRGNALHEPTREFGLLPAHYADGRRGILRLSSAPFIDAAIVTGPYLRLTIPYVTQRHDPLLDENCPTRPSDPLLQGAEKQEALQASRAQRIACFGSLFDVRLNGEQPVNLEFHRVQSTDGGPDGVMAMIDVRALAPGRHTLRIANVDARRNEKAEDGLEPADQSNDQSNDQSTESAAEPAADATADDKSAADTANSEAKAVKDSDSEQPHVIEFWR